MTTAEEWRQVAEFPDYEVSSLGRIRSYRRWGRPRLLRPAMGTTGYKIVSLYNESRPRARTKKLHRLIALAFLGEPSSPDLLVRHLDGNPLNNVPSNLAWGTVSDNMFDAVRHGDHANARKTHCKYGHEFTPENTYIEAYGSRRCRACRGRFRVSSTAVSA